MVRTSCALFMLFGFSLMKTAFTQKQGPTYTIVAPKVFRPYSVYNVTATCFNVPKKVALTLSIQTNNKTVLVEKQTTLKTGTPQIVSLKIPGDVPETDYKFVALGTGGLTINDSRQIVVKRKTKSIFVQTDKPMYKPGQTVLFRVIVVSPDLKPYQEKVDIAIYDPAENKIMQWLGQKNDTGVISQSLPLSDQPPLGDWKIAVTAEGNTFAKGFQVTEYVLPKFEVDVILPSFYLANTNRRDLQEDLPITVIAKYTYGQPVKGRATVTTQMKPYSEYDTTSYKKKSNDVQLVNGKADIALTIKDILGLVPIEQYSYGSYTPDPWSLLSYRPLLVVADVNETVTGTVLSGNNTVDCKTTKYDLTFTSFTPDNYKAGLVYTAYLKLSKPDGTDPDLKDITQPDGEYATILIQATMNYAPKCDRYGNPKNYPSTVSEFNVTVDASGFATCYFRFEENVTSVNLQASFYVEITNSTSYAYKYINVFKSRDDQSIQVSFDSTDGVIKANQNANFVVSSNQPIRMFQYEIMSKGTIQLSGNVEGHSSTEVSFSLWISKELAMKLSPSARIIVWLITKDGEIIADSIELTVSDGFANEVSLSFDHNETTPSENVSLTVKADSGSNVFCLAIDQSVLLLKGGHDITEDLITEDLKEYDSNVPDYYYPFIERRGKRSIWFPYYIGGEDSYSIVNRAGVFILTNLTMEPYQQQYQTYPIYAKFAPGAAGTGAESAPSDNRNNAASPQGPSEKPRTKFPETWIWCDEVTGPDGSVTLQTSVPDTITSWIASAFAMSRTAGLGVATTNAKLTVFKQFFLSPSLPYSIIRGEQFALQVTVFNYLDTALQVEVSLEESTHFTVSGQSSKVQSSKPSVKVDVASNDAVSVYFWIEAQSLGQIPIHIKGESPAAADSVVVMLLVKPEGVQQEYSTSAFIQLPSSGSAYNSTLQVSLPPSGQRVPQSEYIELTVIGDIMGSSVNGLDSLLQMPYGCGEQNMLTFAPDVYICKYLNATGQLTPDIKSKALGFINAGYQRQLTYQRTVDGSFSAFGDSDLSGSIWLSAFTGKCFKQAKDYIPTDDSKIARTMHWIMSNQSPNGSFNEPPNGRVIHVDMQGGSSNGIPLTAYTMNVLLENIDNPYVDSSDLNRRIALALDYIDSQTETVSSDPYTLAIVACALAKAQSQKVHEVLRQLEALAKIEGDKKHWEKADDTPTLAKIWVPPYQQARSVNIEMTAYVLLTYSKLKNLSMALPIVKWIVDQRNANGGFSSTQDTVVALEALAEFATLVVGGSKDRNVSITVTANQISHTFLPVNDETSILLQSYQLPSNTTSVYVEANGRGSALIQLNVKYNVYKTEDASKVTLEIDVTQQGNTITIVACSSWQSKEGSGMVVMEISILTGFKATNVDALSSDSSIRRVESSDEKVVLYFDKLTSKTTCVSLICEKVLAVSNVQNATIKVYPYYDPSNGRVEWYGAPRELGQNEKCSECPKCCEGGKGVEVTDSTITK